MPGRATTSDMRTGSLCLAVRAGVLLSIISVADLLLKLIDELSPSETKTGRSYYQKVYVSVYLYRF